MSLLYLIKPQKISIKSLQSGYVTSAIKKIDKMALDTT